jgi:hypothetical protein
LNSADCTTAQSAPSQKNEAPFGDDDWSRLPGVSVTFQPEAKRPNAAPLDLEETAKPAHKFAVTQKFRSPDAGTTIAERGYRDAAPVKERVL